MDNSILFPGNLTHLTLGICAPTEACYDMDRPWLVVEGDRKMRRLENSGGGCGGGGCISILELIRQLTTTTIIKAMELYSLNELSSRPARTTE